MDVKKGIQETPKEEWKLCLYVIDTTPISRYAYRNIKKICREHLKDNCKIEVIDVQANPEIAREEQIVATPTLVKESPAPRRMLVGDFSKEESVLRALDVQLV